MSDKNLIPIHVLRDSHGKWWMEESDIKRLAPKLEADSQIVLMVQIVRHTGVF